MSDKEDTIAEEKREPGVNFSFTEGVRRIVMAGLGSFNLAQGEVEAFVNRLVERGALAEKDARSILNDFVAKQKKQAEESGKRVGSEMEKRMEQLLNHMNVPTKSDIDQLMQKLAEISDKLDRLEK